MRPPERSLAFVGGPVTEALHGAISDAVSGEAEGVRALRTYNDTQRDRDPAKAAWPASLVLELALRTSSPQELKEHYNFTDEEWAALRYNPIFIRDLEETCEMIKKEGNSFKVKARFQAEAMLDTSWKLVHAPGSEVPPNVKADLIKTTFRVAGFDNKDAVAGSSNALNIQINLGG